MSKRDKYIDDLKKQGLLNDFDVKKELKKCQSKDIVEKLEMLIEAEKNVMKLVNAGRKLDKWDQKHKKNSLGINVADNYKLRSNKISIP